MTRLAMSMPFAQTQRVHTTVHVDLDLTEMVLRCVKVGYIDPCYSLNPIPAPFLGIMSCIGVL